MYLYLLCRSIYLRRYRIKYSLKAIYSLEGVGNRLSLLPPACVCPHADRRRDAIHPEVEELGDRSVAMFACTRFYKELKTTQTIAAADLDPAQLARDAH